MPELGETLRLVEVICARLCHDLGGLIGTVGNAIDMVAEDANRDDEVLAFASSAARMLSQRLRLLRAAWGPETDPVVLPALIRLAAPPLAARRIALDTRPLPPDCRFPPAVARVVLNLIVLAGDCLPKGGTIVLLGEPSDLLIRIDGQDAAWPAGFAACMNDEAAALAALGALASAQSAQMPLTALLALSRKLRLSPVLSAASGVAAVRLSAA
jgi:histidine phosphotransferase ChpT